MFTCVSDDQSRRRENETTASYNNRRFEGRARKRSPRTPLLRQCLFYVFFRLALKINAHGGRETEKLIILPLASQPVVPTVYKPMATPTSFLPVYTLTRAWSPRAYTRIETPHSATAWFLLLTGFVMTVIEICHSLFSSYIFVRLTGVLSFICRVFPAPVYFSSQV